MLSSVKCKAVAQRTVDFSAVKLSDDLYECEDILSGLVRQDYSIFKYAMEDIAMIALEIVAESC